MTNFEQTYGDQGAPLPERQPSNLEILMAHPSSVAFIVLGLVAIVAMFTQEDPDVLKGILSGCVTLAVCAGIFL